MGRLGLTLTVAAVAALVPAVLLFFLLRVSLWLHLRAGGEPLVDLRVGFRMLGLRRERRFAIRREEGRALLRRLAGEAARRWGRGPEGPGGPSQAEARGPGAPVAGSGSPARARPAGPSLSRLGPLVPDILRAASLERVDVALALGAGDAAGTAVLCGLINAVGGTGLALLSRIEGAPRRASFQAVPRWGAKADARLRVDCIARPRLSQAIFAAWRVYRVYRPDRPAGARPAAGTARVRVPARFSPAKPARP